MRYLKLFVLGLFLISGAASASDVDSMSFGESYVVKGVVRWVGATPYSKTLAKIPYDDVCGRRADNLIEFYLKRIEDVAVWLMPAAGSPGASDTLGATPWKKDKGEKEKSSRIEPYSAGRDLVVSESGCEYKPRISVVPVGATVDIVNVDRKDHWVVVRGRHQKKVDATERYGVGWPEYEFKTPHVVRIPAGDRLKVHSSKTDVLYIQSGLHFWMKSWVVVTNAPYYAVTNRRGQFKFTGVVPGIYELHTWHPYLGDQVQEITVAKNIRWGDLYVSYKEVLPDQYKYLEPAIPSIPREIKETHIDEINP